MYMMGNDVHDAHNDMLHHPDVTDYVTQCWIHSMVISQLYCWLENNLISRGIVLQLLTSEHWTDSQANRRILFLWKFEDWRVWTSIGRRSIQVGRVWLWSGAPIIFRALRNYHFFNYLLGKSGSLSRTEIAITVALSMIMLIMTFCLCHVAHDFHYSGGLGMMCDPILDCLHGNLFQMCSLRIL